MKRAPLICLALLLSKPLLPAKEPNSWTVVDTSQNTCYDTQQAITPPAPGQSFFGQDAQYLGAQPAYKDNGDGTITDQNTGLMWSKAVDAKKVSLKEAEALAIRMNLGGYKDWRVPTIKELYSLIDFRGATGLAGPQSQTAPRSAIPYINTDFFDFLYGAADERYIDAQWLSSTKYVSTTMNSLETLFGVNFADGRIKGYGFSAPNPLRREKKFYARYVRGEPYGENHFQDNGDGTVTDQATGLTWMKADSGKGMDWEHALRYAQALTLAGHDDWRLPNAKELQSIMDYTRSPDTSDSPAIDPVFDTTLITNEAGQKDWPFFWTSTTHMDGLNASQAVYVAFGRAIGAMHGQIMDVHGAGAQRSDPKTGFARLGHGPQGDAQRVQNFVRCVRGGNVKLQPTPEPAPTDPSKYPNLIHVGSMSCHSEAVSSSLKNPVLSPGREIHPFIQHLDRDGDGKVSREEFDGPKNHFTDFDANRDGYISAEEAPDGPPPGKPDGQGPSPR